MARIIYVEDDDLIAEVVKDILTKAGHLIGSVAHGSLGYETIAFKKPDLVMLDLSLPGLDGIEIVRRLRQLSATHLTPILILTGRRDEGMAEKALGAGANAFMTKPFVPSELVAKVSAVLSENPFNVRRDARR